MGKCVTLMISGSGGYLLYLRSISDRQDKLEACQAKIKEESEKALAELKAEVARTDESVSRYQEESELKHQKLEIELRELKFLKELWMSIVFQESSKTEVEARSE
ncbi:unnamed protein product [Miscanthus lutarioriparius]|uniref:Uncharacterized protein n=1 Tax=Miscanthus lutarioriparius TaxID=422564 RepID=A0A811QDL7_9POAL|nr:unnamed protein product [Miscanthus lutarioriparius]